MAPLPEAGTQLRIEQSLVTVRHAEFGEGDTVDLFVIDAVGVAKRLILTSGQLEQALVPSNDRGGDPQRALTGLWGRWMQHAVPRIRSAVLATRPLRPYAHQDEAVYEHMLSQPRLRFLLGDEPGTGKTIMAGMYLVEGRRQRLVPGRALFVVPAHLVRKWRRDLRRFFGVEAKTVSTAIASDPADLDPRFDTWVVSLDLFTHNADVRSKLAGTRSSWSLVVFDEAHRLTPTSQHLAAARQLSARTHHLLLMTATPHRGKEHYFRGLMNLLDPTYYPWDPKQREYESALIPSKLSFLRRMKEELVDHEGKSLFPPRFSETVSVKLNIHEAGAYDAVMDYVDTYYEDSATLARSIYGKRAASSLEAVAATLRRRSDALKGAAHERSTPIAPVGLFSDAGLGSAADDDDEWAEAEDAVVSAKTKDKVGELTAVANLLGDIGAAQAADVPAKWVRLEEVLQLHGIAPGHGQLLVFTEFADTAHWLHDRFAADGFSVETLEGAVGHDHRDELQERFLNGQFQILVSTDAGGEGIDLQSANVMVDWDLPWSMVRLEQRMGRLHRVGQTRSVHVYHLVAPHTREGRVQEVMLTNLEAASMSLEGKLYDLLDATAERAGFDWGKAMVDAQAGRQVTVPDVETLVASARSLVADERSLATPANVDDALERFANDRLEAINPVIVDAMVDQIAATDRWAIERPPARGIKRLRATRGNLPAALGGRRTALVAADGSSVRQAINDGATELDDVVVLGPTEEPFHDLIQYALGLGEADLVRGAALVDTASLTSYVLALYDADIQAHDGTQMSTLKSPLLIRCSGNQALAVSWESLMTLRAPTEGDPGPVGPTALPPATRHDAEQAAKEALRRQVDALKAERLAWIQAARSQLDTTQYRFEESIADRPPGERRMLLEQFEQDKSRRLDGMKELSVVSASAARLVGWVFVAGGARADALGYDPDSETLAVAMVVEELERLGFEVDDRQTARLGYDLYARHRQTREQRLVEVKGLVSDIRPIWLEQNEWAQAQQRGSEYWLYVVDSCGTQPTIRLRLQDPAMKLGGGPRRIERFQIPIAELNRLIGGQP
jgi:superfamily II DNA or RNA helicase